MGQRPISQRVTVLEQRVERLETLPNEVAELREDMDQHFDRIEATMAAGFAAVDRRFDLMDRRLDKMDGRFDLMDGKIDLMDGKLNEMVTALLERIDEGNRRTTVLHEDLVARIAMLGERWKDSPPN